MINATDFLKMSTNLDINVSKYLAVNHHPRTLRDFAENHGSWLVGIEEYLSHKLGFKCLLFTSNQKQYLKLANKEKCCYIGNRLHVGPLTYQKIKELSSN